TSRLWGSQLRLPDFPELPAYRVSGYEPVQAFHLECWCEKSTMNDVLEPLCQHYGMNLQTGLGELSITATLALVHRLQEADKPARIFYVSDARSGGPEHAGLGLAQGGVLCAHAWPRGRCTRVSGDFDS
ncbi:MAG TPA: hypothetical protein VIY29_03475, partial [Ktedonobacteraceae bacterium]